ncbi:energy transducer TonB [Roseomonas sp. SSH11]|uniref:Energy transducer TonB n=1 Tax=Pararoseomonas baculiformis TaxID=2820812 RepID=A0ABS4ACB5_9PROT|nr:energy transducer TonB [Pararoseomonas baculiformis]MBP0444616.1 energy transducer TonB [Pararoseomonas baculiformis]
MSAAGISATGPFGPLGGPRLPRAARRGAGRPGGWRGAALALSLLLHLALGWWLLFGVERRAVEEPPAAPSAMDVVFEGGSAEESPGPPPDFVPAPEEPPGQEALPVPPAPVPRLAEPPPVPAQPELQAQPVPAPPLPAPPLPAPPVPPPVAQAPVPVPPPPAPLPPVPPVAQALPPVPLPAQPLPSDMALPPPPPAAEAPRRTEMAALPMPPPPMPEPPAAPPEAAAARPAPTPRQQQAQARPRPAPSNPFAGALDLSQGGPISLGRPAPPASDRAARRNQDSGTATGRAERGTPSPEMRFKGADPGASWWASVVGFANSRKYYPRQAAMMGEDGSTTVRFIVHRDGRVTDLQVIRRSGSYLLDAAWLGVFRGATLPPFPPGTQGDSTEVEFTLNYVLRGY